MAYSMMDRKCEQCGRLFLPAPYHHWRVKDKLFCCYTCMRKYERELREGKK